MQASSFNAKKVNKVTMLAVAILIKQAVATIIE